MSDTNMRERSPRAPIITLRKAVERAREFYELNKRHPVRVESAFASWNYKPKSSGARQTLATLIMYGILQDSGSGSDRKVQLTETAWRYVVDERPEPKAQALKAMALGPKIMAELWEAWGAEPPSDAECLAQLHIDRGFTEDTARDVLAIYKDNIAFAPLGGPAMVEADVDEDEEHRAGDDLQDFVDAMAPAQFRRRPPPPTPPPPAHEQRVSMMSGERELVTGLLSKGASFRVIVNGTVGVKEIDRLIRKLELDKEILADTEIDDDDVEDLLA